MRAQLLVMFCAFCLFGCPASTPDVPPVDDAAKTVEPVDVAKADAAKAEPESDAGGTADVAKAD